MEGAGFCVACQESGAAWWIIKGVSDFGDAESKDGLPGEQKDRKLWQFPATVASVSFAKAFIYSMYDREAS